MPCAIPTLKCRCAAVCCAAAPTLPTPAEVDSWAKMYKAAYTKLLGSVAGAGSPAAAQAGTSAAAGQALGGAKSSGGKKAAK